VGREFRSRRTPSARRDGGFEKHDAYQSWNDHFAVDATFAIDGAAVRAVTDIAVSRVEPIR
jgi:hypothetical protein